MLTVKFTEYVLPNGRQRPLEIVCDQITYDKSQILINMGFTFGMEVLRNGITSFTIEDKKVGEDASIVLARGNSPQEYIATVKRMIEEFDAGRWEEIKTESHTEDTRDM